MAVFQDLMPSPTHDEDVLPLLLRHKVQVLRAAGFSQSQTADQAGISVDSVRRIEREKEVGHADERKARLDRSIGRPSLALPFADKVRAWLREDRELPTLELLRRAKELGYEGHKSAFYALVTGLRPKASAAPIVRFEGLPGEFSQHDFGQVDVRFLDGRVKRVHFFASRLKYSRFLSVTITTNERTETLLRCLARHLVAFGGLPLLAVFDRPRTIVLKGGKGREVLDWNVTFAQAIIELGVGVEMCASRSGNQKGSVENLVGWVKKSFFKVRKFSDEQDLLEQLARWLHEVNHERPCRATGIFPETRRLEELPRLRPIKVFPETFALRIPLVVGPDATVLYEGLSYSMPPKLARQPVTLFLYETKLVFVSGNQSVTHARTGQQGMTLPVHREAKIDAVHGPRAKLYAKRQFLLELGSNSERFLTELCHRSGGDTASYVEDLYRLFKQHGDEAMRDALTLALKNKTFSVEAIARILGEVRPEGGLLPSGRASQPRGPQGRREEERERRAEPKGGRR